LSAAGDVDLDSAKITVKKAGYTIDGANVILRGKTRLKAFAEFSSPSDITATAGDVTIDQLSLKGDRPVVISGTNVTIGVMENGKTPRSTLTQKNLTVDVLATDTIHIDNLALSSVGDVTIDTTGTTVDLLASKLKGKKATPTITVSAGPGSTCDLTGTQVVGATLVTSCDTVIGP